MGCRAQHVCQREREREREIASKDAAAEHVQVPLQAWGSPSRGRSQCAISPDSYRADHQALDVAAAMGLSLPAEVVQAWAIQVVPAKLICSASRRV